jgi:dihydropyrimidinase
LGFDLIVSGGRIIHEGGSFTGDVAIAGERIAEVSSRVTAEAERRIDASGLAVLPGLIDPHVHLGLSMKGTRASDDVASGTRAGLFGGVTTVIDFTVQRPGETLAACLDARLAEFQGKSYSDYSLHANVTDFAADFDERLPGALKALARRGSTSLKVFTTYSRDGMRIPPSILPSILRSASQHGFLVLVHAEDDEMVEEATGRLLESGKGDPCSFPRSRPAEAERAAVEEVLRAAAEAESPVYFVHVSTAGALAAIDRARSRMSFPIFAETCPQYLFLSDERYEGKDAAQHIVTPPLRSPADRDALVSGMLSGKIDTVATDHCPFRREDRERPQRPFTALPSGLPGIETRLVLLNTLAARNPEFGLPGMVRLLSTSPARIFGLHPRKGTLEPGADADLVLFDPETRWTIDPGSLHMNTDFSPYEGVEVQGKVRWVLLRGRVLVEEGRLAGGPAGSYVHRPARPAATPR